MLLEGVTHLPNLTAGIMVIMVQGSAKAVQVYVGGGISVSPWGPGPRQVRWARPFRNENWRGWVPCVAVGDLIRFRQNKQGTWELSQAPGVT